MRAGDDFSSSSSCRRDVAIVGDTTGGGNYPLVVGEGDESETERERE